MVLPLSARQLEVLESIRRFAAEHRRMPSVRELAAVLGLSCSTTHQHLKALRRKGFIDSDGTAHGLVLRRLPAEAVPARVPSSGLAEPPSVSASGMAETEAAGASVADAPGPARGGGYEAGARPWLNDPDTYPVAASSPCRLVLVDSTVDVPVLGAIAAGSPIEAFEDHDEVLSLPATMASAGSYALRVRGDSMIDDHILDGDIVIVRPQPLVEQGEIAVALLPDGTATLKRVYREKGRVRLQPANDRLDPIFADDVTIRGKVVAVLRLDP